MGVVVVLLLAVFTAGAVVYPLLPGRAQAQELSVVTEGEIERAVRALRRARSRDGDFCPTCGSAYQSGDQFCVHCGGTLPQTEAGSGGAVCSSCKAAIREGDRFCAKCGRSIGAGEAA